MLENYIYRTKIKDSEALNRKLLYMFDQIPDNDSTYNLAISKFDGHNHPDVWKVPMKWKWFDIQCLPGLLDSEGNLIEEEYEKYVKPHRPENIPDHCAYKGVFLDWAEDELNEFAYKMIKPHKTDLDFKIDIRGMWFHQMQQNDYMEWDNHFYSQWAAVYYIELPEPDMATEFIHPDTEEEFQPQNIQPGDMVIFPTFLLHRSPYITDTRRKSVIAWGMDIACLYHPDYFKKLSETHPQNWSS